MRWAAFAEHMHHGHHGHADYCCIDPGERSEGDPHHSVGFDFHVGPFGRRDRVRSELWGLFEDWLDSLGDEIVAFARESGSVNGAAVAERFKISERAARHLLRRLKREGRLRSRGLEPVDDEAETAAATD
jgi:hypothetical protein